MVAWNLLKQSPIRSTWGPKLALPRLTPSQCEGVFWWRTYLGGAPSIHFDSWSLVARGFDPRQ